MTGNWDVDRARGEEFEAIYRKTRQAIMTGDTEVKGDDGARKYGNFYFEYKQLPYHGSSDWVDSALKITNAANWVQFVGHAFVGMPVWALRAICRDVVAERGDGARRTTEGPNPTRGIVVPVSELLPRYLRVLDRVEQSDKAAA